MQVLCVLGVGDEHGRPLLKPQVREAQQVVVKGQNPVPGDRCETGFQVKFKTFLRPIETICFTISAILFLVLPNSIQQCATWIWINIALQDTIIKNN